MPGYILGADCPCGFDGVANVGVTDPPTMRSLVPAYNPETESLITIVEGEACSPNVITYPGPYELAGPLAGPFVGYLDQNLAEFSKCRSIKFQCPRCGQLRLQFQIVGMWD